MKHYTFQIGLLLIFLFSSNLIAQSHEAKLELLSNSKGWLNLMHYEVNDSSPTGLKSAIHAESFFLSSKGMTHPKLELIATLESFTGKQKVEQVHCQFPARLMWLQQNFEEISKNKYDFGVCKDYLDWSQEGRIQSISVVFATGYLGNPASFYGHTLLKFNSANQATQTSLQDNSLNFGAIVPDNENPLVYIVKGVFGGYEAGFSQIKYYFHNENYGEIELRDMWEYELNLDKRDLDYVVAHSWEVMSKEYTYYFLRENCAYRMGELFSILDDVNVIPENSVYTYPQSLIRKITTTKYKNKDLLKSVTLNSSRQSRLYDKYSQLNASEIKVLNEIVQSIDTLDESLSQLDLNSQHKVIDTLLDYYQLVGDELQGDEDERNVFYRKVLSKRFSLPAGQSDFKVKKSKIRPDESREPSLVAFVNANNSEYGSVQRVIIRPAYYDSLDASGGHIAFSELKMGEMAISHIEGGFNLDYLNVFSIESVNSKSTGLPGDDGFSWRLKFGAEQFEPNCNSCRVVRFQGDFGYTFNLSDTAIMGAYLGGATHETYKNSKNYFVRTSFFYQQNLSENFNYKINYNIRDDFDGYSKDFTEIQMRYAISRDWDIRALYSKSSSSTIGLSLGYYW